MRENTNTRNIILAILALIILIAGIVYFTRDKAEVVNQDNQVKKEVIKEFGEITDFVKTDLTKEEKENLKIILEQRKDRQIQIKDILDHAYEKGEMEEAWIEVQGMREKCKNRILPFIAEDKIESFAQYCSQAAEDLDANYVSK